MEYLSYTGITLFVIGFIWFYVLAFAQSILWGIGCVLFSRCAWCFWCSIGSELVCRPSRCSPVLAL
jgi:hypothetical protein